MLVTVRVVCAAVLPHGQFCGRQCAEPEKCKFALNLPLDPCDRNAAGLTFCVRFCHAPACAFVAESRMERVKMQKIQREDPAFLCGAATFF